MQFYAVIKKYSYFSTIKKLNYPYLKLDGNRKTQILILCFFILFLNKTERRYKIIKNYYFDFYVGNNNLLIQIANYL